MKTKQENFAAYVIYGGQYIYRRSDWHTSSSEARREGLKNASPAEKDFIGVVGDQSTGTFYKAILRSLTGDSWATKNGFKSRGL